MNERGRAKEWPRPPAAVRQQPQLTPAEDLGWCVRFTPVPGVGLAVQLYIHVCHFKRSECLQLFRFSREWKKKRPHWIWHGLCVCAHVCKARFTQIHLDIYAYCILTFTLTLESSFTSSWQSLYQTKNRRWFKPLADCPGF